MIRRLTLALVLTLSAACGPQESPVEVRDANASCAASRERTTRPSPAPFVAGVVVLAAIAAAAARKNRRGP